MKKQSSYIFLQHPSKEKKEKENGKTVLEIGKNVCGFISRTFPSVEFIGDKKDLFNKQCKADIHACSVVFTIHTVASIEYLDISVEGKTKVQIIGCLEQIQRELFDSGIRKYYVDIVSYDAISEYYCNKMAVKLNSLERSLRKLMFNIYILNFGKDYYKATMSNDLQNKIYGLIGSTTDLTQIKNAYGVSNEQAKAIARMQQFFYSYELADMRDFLFEPTWISLDEEAKSGFLSSHSNLSALSDEELRTAFSQFSPKSDWDRFFSAKIPIENARDLINRIRIYRNSVAHFKSFNSCDYQDCSKLIKVLNNAVNKAIIITEDVDFANKNKEAIAEAVERIRIIMEPIFIEIQRNIAKSFQPLIDALNKSNDAENSNQEKND